jgi:ribosomal protein L37AE/L43A
LLIRRSWHDVTENRLKHGRCPECGTEISGVWEKNARGSARLAPGTSEKYSHLNL